MFYLQLYISYQPTHTKKAEIGNNINLPGCASLLCYQKRQVLQIVELLLEYDSSLLKIKKTKFVYQKALTKT